MVTHKMLKIDGSDEAEHSVPHGANERAEKLKFIVASIRRGWFTILACVLLALLLALSYLGFVQPTYTASTLIMIDPRKLQVLPQQSVFGESALDTPTVESQVELLKSPKISLSVVRGLNLIDDPEFRASDASSVPSLLSMIRGIIRRESGHRAESMSFQYRKEQATLEKLRRNFSVRRSGISYVIQVTFQSEDAEKA